MSQPRELSLTKQLDELLGDRRFHQLVDVCARDLRFMASLPSEAARRRFVFSAIGEPRTITLIHELWVSDRFRVAKMIMRRRVIDLLRKDGARPRHPSLQEIEVEDAVALVADDAPPADVQIEQHRLVQNVRDALESFANEGAKQRMQAQLLERLVLDGVSYQDVASDLECNVGALRVRLYAAKQALVRHIQNRHPELEFQASSVSAEKRGRLLRRPS
jgi:hypothetical protein